MRKRGKCNNVFELPKTWFFIATQSAENSRAVEFSSHS